MSPPLTPGADEARRMLEQELSKPEYLNPQGWLEELVNRLFDWLVGDRRITPMNDGQATSLTVAVVLLVVAVGVGIWVFLGPLGASRRRPREVFASEDARTSGELRADSARLASDGRWGPATLQRFRAMVRALDERAIIEPNPGLTALEAAGRAALRLPTVAERLTVAAGVFDGLAYGGRSGSAEQYRVMAALDEEVAALRPTLPTDVAGTPDAVAVEVAE
ncbi:MAG: DUF4129 domain-containing protein [Actinobacteria bacterium]|nr:DUF4129 domain-containing protein [Actinomycetota bacterium]